MLRKLGGTKLAPGLGVGVFTLGLLLLLVPSPILAQVVSPDVAALRGLIKELERVKPPADPVDLAAIVADAEAALANLSGSTVPYGDVPESLLGARLGMRIANLLFHRLGVPQEAGTILGRVQMVYQAYPPGAGSLATATGDRASAVRSLPVGYRPAQNASATNPCGETGLSHLQFYTMGVDFMRSSIPGFKPALEASRMTLECVPYASASDGVAQILTYPAIDPADPSQKLVTGHYEQQGETGRFVDMYGEGGY